MMTDGRDEVEELLRGVGPSDLPIWDERADLSPSSAAWELWGLLRSRRWPEGQAASGMGRAILSKLLAAKRPHLFPIYDRYVGYALLEDPDQDIWKLWRDRFEGDAGKDLKGAAESLQKEAGIPRGVSVLRILDVAIWMRVHGYRFCSDQQVRQLADAPQFWTS